MARLYSALDALRMGQAINGMRQGWADRTNSALQTLSDSIGSYIGAKSEEEKEAARRKSAIEYLMGNGYDTQKAQQFVDTLDPSEAVRYAQGRFDKAVDTADERKYEGEIHARNRGEAIDDRKAQWAHEGDVMESRLKNDIASAEFNDINNRIALLQSKVQSGSLPSKSDIEEMRKLKKMRDEWLKAHPNYSQIYYMDWMDDGDSTSDPFETKETTIAAMNALLGKDGFVSPKALNDFNTRFLWKTGQNLFNDPDYKDLYKHLASRQKGSKLARNASNPDAAGIATQEDYEKLKLNAAFQQRVKTLYDAIIKAARGKGEFPKLNDNELKALKEKFGKNQKYLTRYTRG